ncbi:MAG: diguanylate cyclase domain-containing protein, partial [Azonexus sp.]
FRRQLETEPVIVGDLQLTVTASGGGSTFLSTDTIPAAAMQRADAALYRAKAAGRNRVALAEVSPSDGGRHCALNPETPPDPTGGAPVPDPTFGGRVAVTPPGYPIVSVVPRR